METAALTPTYTQVLLDYDGAPGRVGESRAQERASRPRPVGSAVLSGEDLAELAKFEGEGGLEAPGTE